MRNMIFAAMLSTVLLLPSVALSKSSITSHVTGLPDGSWQAIFKVELWSKTGVTDTWRLTINQLGCQAAPFVEQTVSPEGQVVRQDEHVTVGMPWTQP